MRTADPQKRVLVYEPTDHELAGDLVRYLEHAGYHVKYRREAEAAEQLAYASWFRALILCFSEGQGEEFLEELKRFVLRFPFHIPKILVVYPGIWNLQGTPAAQRLLRRMCNAEMIKKPNWEDVVDQLEEECRWEGYNDRLQFLEDPRLGESLNVVLGRLRRGESLDADHEGASAELRDLCRRAFDCEAIQFEKHLSPARRGQLFQVRCIEEARKDTHRIVLLRELDDLEDPPPDPQADRFDHFPQVIRRLGAPLRSTHLSLAVFELEGDLDWTRLRNLSQVVGQLQEDSLVGEEAGHMTAGCFTHVADYIIRGWRRKYARERKVKDLARELRPSAGFRSNVEEAIRRLAEALEANGIALQEQGNELCLELSVGLVSFPDPRKLLPYFLKHTLPGSVYDVPFSMELEHILVNPANQHAWVSFLDGASRQPVFALEAQLELQLRRLLPQDYASLYRLELALCHPDLDITLGELGGRNQQVIGRCLQAMRGLAELENPANCRTYQLVLAYSAMAAFCNLKIGPRMDPVELFYATRLFLLFSLILRNFRDERWMIYDARLKPGDGSLRWDPENSVFRSGDRRITIPGNRRYLLQYLCENAGVPLSWTQLARPVYHDTDEQRLAESLKPQASTRRAYKNNTQKTLSRLIDDLEHECPGFVYLSTQGTRDETHYIFHNPPLQDDHK